MMTKDSIKLILLLSTIEDTLKALGFLAVILHFKRNFLFLNLGTFIDKILSDLVLLCITYDFLMCLSNSSLLAA